MTWFYGRGNAYTSANISFESEAPAPTISSVTYNRAENLLSATIEFAGEHLDNHDRTEIKDLGTQAITYLYYYRCQTNTATLIKCNVFLTPGN